MPVQRRRRMAAGGKKKEDAAFKEYVSLMLDKKKFRPDEKSECRWHAESEDGGGEYTTTASGKSVFCTCNGFRVSTGRECKYIRLIRLISGLLGFAATREAAIGEIAGARCPSCKKADFREYCKRPTTGKVDTRRYLCNACGHKFSEAPEFGPAGYSPEMIMQSLSMYCRGMSTRQISDHWREARRSADERYPSHAAVSLWARRYLAAIAGYIARLRPTCPTYRAPTRCTSWSRRRRTTCTRSWTTARAGCSAPGLPTPRRRPA